jgi:hypothetical protein
VARGVLQRRLACGKRLERKVPKVSREKCEATILYETCPFSYVLEHFTITASLRGDEDVEKK